MAAYVVPMVVWQDFEGFYAAAPAETFLATIPTENIFQPLPLVAVDDTARGALRQIETYLEWWYKRFPAADEPDLLDVKLTHVAITVRPQYVVKERVYPCDDLVKLRLPCVQGHQKNGLLVCSLPTLGQQFFFHDADVLQQLIAGKVRQALEDSTPQELSRLLPPKSVRLEQVTVSLPRFSRAWRQPQVPLPVLAQVAHSMVQPAFRKRFTAAWQRESELRALTHCLQREKACLALIGSESVGKSTLLANAVRTVELVSRRDADKKGAERPADAGPKPPRFWQTSAARLIAGMQYLGQWQERCETLIAELSSIDGVLCVENLLDLTQIGGQGPGDSIAAFLLPYIRNDQLRLVGEATSPQWDACRRLLPGFAEAFQIVRVDDMEVRRARAALDNLLAALNRETKLELEEGCTETVCRLHRRFLPYRALPGPAARFVTQLWQQAKQDRLTRLTRDQVVSRFVQDTGLPETILLDRHVLKSEDVLEAFARRVIGQDAACHAAAAVVTRLKAGLNDPQRPISVLLFCGPTGVGKTELAKTLADYLFGHGQDRHRLVRLDMSEYSSPWTAARLVAKDERTPSDLIARVRQQPFVVVLFDEIEKAASPVFDMLLGLFDEGRLTDPHGRTTEFRSAIVILTSNLGVSTRPSIGFAGSSLDSFDAEVRSFFRPEFYNRLDGVVTFGPLDPDVCLAITRKELREISLREGVTKSNLQLHFTEGLVRRLAQRGFDPRYGARPLQRAVETSVVAPLSHFLVNYHGLRDAALELDVDAQGNLRIELR